MNELKPCPFCGSIAEIRATKEQGVFVECIKCEARTRGLFDLVGDGVITAVSLVVHDWNQRVDSKLTKGEY